MTSPDLYPADWHQRVLVCGSRDWEEWQVVHAVLDGLWQTWSVTHACTGGGSFTVIHGGQSAVIDGKRVGADYAAETWTSSPMHDPDTVTVLPFPAHWETYGRAAGPIRNQRMLDEGRPEVVWAFVTKPLPESRGTYDMVQQAWKAGVPTYVVDAWADV